MIIANNLKDVLEKLGYKTNKTGNIYEKHFNSVDCDITVNFDEEKIIYPEDKGLKIHRDTTTNFSANENFVVLECVTRLFEKGYRPEHIELERPWTIGHSPSGGYGDVVVSDGEKTLFIIECKTWGAEYNKERKNLFADGGQLFSYWQQDLSCKWLVLYASNYEDEKVEYKEECVSCKDDNSILNAKKKDVNIKTYEDAHKKEDLFNVWEETYEKRILNQIIFGDDSVAYKLQEKPLRKKDLKDFTADDKIVNSFEEILRHNNVSDKENAFNRLIALFICKLVDEITKSDDDEVEFQYKVGTDTYENLQDRLQRLHKEGMDKFMKEDIFYVSDDYAENLISTYTGHKRKNMIEELKKTIRILKFYTNNDFAFKDVHNEELFYQNGKILVEVVQLFQEYRIIGSNDLQFLGDLFEQLLNKGFKQNEGQFFTPIPIVRFIWKSLPLNSLMDGNDNDYPRIIDYACGAGHFLTEAYDQINIYRQENNLPYEKDWERDKIYGIEKDYRLARVSKISMFMHGANESNIIFGDGLDNYKDKEIKPNSFDILVANPPYSVSGFKQHLKLKDNNLSVIEAVSNDGSEIETLFVERINQLVKPHGFVAVILPVSILNKENNSYILARENILQHFMIKCIVNLGNKTFGATGTNTVIMFLQKYNEPPKRNELVGDSVEAILENRDLANWEDNEILLQYINEINVNLNDYFDFITKGKPYDEFKENEYLNQYINKFKKSVAYKNKIKQATFKRLSENEKKDTLNKMFFGEFIEIEKEKLFYFGLTYNQRTLIINAPKSNKDQEKFLGYSWSNRKGQEGIKIKSEGGELYSNDNSKFNYIINRMMNNNEIDIAALSNKYYFMWTKDMLDFQSDTFNKVIKTKAKRNKKIKTGYKLYKLNNDKVFNIQIGKRVVTEELSDTGIPVYSANVYKPFGLINKQSVINNFSKPLVLYGIDGDWAVNITTPNEEFYPTDHCGVIEVLDDNINVKYFALALEYEGMCEDFSRINRASIQRVQTITVQIPTIKKQKAVIKKFEKIEKEINECRLIISKINDEINEKYKNMFGGNNYKTEKMYTLFVDLKDAGNKLAENKIQEKGKYPVITQERKFISGYTDEEIAITGEKLLVFGDHTCIVKYVDFDFVRGADGTQLIKTNDKICNLRYLESFINNINIDNAERYERHFKYLKEINVPLPPITEQRKFEKFVRKRDEKKKDAELRIAILESKRKSLIFKYFD